jgi:hypothetical protein
LLYSRAPFEAQQAYCTRQTVDRPYERSVVEGARIVRGSCLGPQSRKNSTDDLLRPFPSTLFQVMNKIRRLLQRLVEASAV